MAQSRTARIRLEPLSELVVFKLYEAHLDDQLPDALTASEIALQFQVQIPLRLVVSSIEFVRARARGGEDGSHVRRVGKAGSYSYAISSSGILWVEQQLSNADSLVAYFAANGDDSIEDVAGFKSIFLDQNERFVENQWQPLPLDRSSDQFREIETSIARTTEIIRGDNGLASNFPEERKGILSALLQGLELLRKEAPSARQIVDLLVRPLNWTATQFAKTVIGTAAAETAKKLTHFLLTFFT